MKQFLTRTYSIAVVVVLALLLACGALLGACSSASNGSAGSSQVSTSSVSQTASSSSKAASSSASKSKGSTKGASSSSVSASNVSSRGTPSKTIDENGEYTDKDSVALYIHTYGHLPSNYVSKTKARKAGWNSKEGNLWEVLPGKSIGGSEFYNDDGKLPDASGRRWTECDIDYNGGYRGAKRIVFSNDGLVFYTGDHYETFEQLY